MRNRTRCMCYSIICAMNSARVLTDTINKCQLNSFVRHKQFDKADGNGKTMGQQWAIHIYREPYINIMLEIFVIKVASCETVVGGG